MRGVPVAGETPDIRRGAFAPPVYAQGLFSGLVDAVALDAVAGRLFRREGLKNVLARTARGGAAAGQIQPPAHEAILMARWPVVECEILLIPSTRDAHFLGRGKISPLFFFGLFFFTFLLFSGGLAILAPLDFGGKLREPGGHHPAHHTDGKLRAQAGELGGAKRAGQRLFEPGLERFLAPGANLVYEPLDRPGKPDGRHPDIFLGFFEVEKVGIIKRLLGFFEFRVSGEQ